MFNPTDEFQSVQMAFPFVGKLERLSADDIIIRADDSILPYEIYVGDVVDNHGNPRQEEKEVNFEFSNIISKITDKPYIAKHFKENDMGWLYTIDVEPTTEEKIYFSVDFDYNSEKTKVFTNGFNSHEHTDGKTRVVSRCYGPRTLEIFVLGENIDLNINVYSDGELKHKTDLFKHQISMEEKEIRTYLMEYIKNYTKSGKEGLISETQLYNLYAKSLDNQFSRNISHITEDDIMVREYQERIFILVYTVEFPPNMTKEVSISYITTGTMDRSQTVNPLYTFDYILNPAKNWKDFKNLNIEIIPAKEAPYVIDSNIELARKENGVYTAAFVDLPKEDLSFTLYANEEITLYDRAEGAMKNIFGPFTTVAIGGAVLLVLITIIKKISKRKSICAKNER